MALVVDTSGYSEITALGLIRRAMLLINAVAAGEMPAEEELNDGLLTLREMIDNWNTKTLAVYSSLNENLQLVPGKSEYAWGPMGDFVSPRPVFLNNVTHVRNGVSTPVRIVAQEDYDLISIKGNPSPIVEQALYVNTHPQGRLIVWPVPTEATVLNVNAAMQLTAPVTLQTLISLPPGYRQAMRYNLAVMLWPEYTNTSTDIDSIKQIARTSLGDVKRANITTPTMTFQDMPDTEISRSWDWRAG